MIANTNDVNLAALEISKYQKEAVAALAKADQGPRLVKLFGSTSIQ